MNDMTREEIKNLLPVMQAFADGKEIQYVNSEGRVSDKETMFDDVSYAFRYRIKPEPTYRPFRNTEECWAEMQKHSPFGWVKKDEYYFQITDETKVVNNITLHRIECVTAFGDVECGEKGGWIESEKNLSQRGDAWSAITPWSEITPWSARTPRSAGT